MKNKHYSKNKKCFLCKILITNESTHCNSCRGKLRIGTGKGLPKCKDCGKQLKRYNAKYCKKHSQIGNKNHNFGKHLTEECKNKIREKTRGEKCHLYIHGETLKKHYCIDCKINEISYPNWLYGNKRCIYCSNKGENNANYINGLSNEPYSLDWTEELRESIRKRDNYECQNCGTTEEEQIIMIGRILTIHHIDYDKKNCKEDNLITTCLWCNTRANYNRDYWYSYFTYIVELKNEKKHS